MDAVGTGDLVRFKKGDVITFEGEAASEIYILIKGEVELWTKSRDETIILTNLKNNGIIGDIDWLYPSRVMTATAVTPVVCISVHKDKIIKQFAEATPFVRAWIRNLCNYYTAMKKKDDILQITPEKAKNVIDAYNKRQRDLKDDMAKLIKDSEEDGSFLMDRPDQDAPLDDKE